MKRSRFAAEGSVGHAQWAAPAGPTTSKPSISGRKRTIAARAPRFVTVTGTTISPRDPASTERPRVEGEVRLEARPERRLVAPRDRGGRGLVRERDGRGLYRLGGRDARLDALDGRDDQRRARALSRPSERRGDDRPGSERVEARPFEAVQPRLEPLRVRAVRGEHERARQVVLGAHVARQLAVLGLARAPRCHVEREQVRVRDERHGHVAVVGDAHLPRPARRRRFDGERDVRGGRRLLGLRRLCGRGRRRGRRGAGGRRREDDDRRRERCHEAHVSPGASRGAPCPGWRSRTAS